MNWDVTSGSNFRGKQNTFGNLWMTFWSMLCNKSDQSVIKNTQDFLNFIELLQYEIVNTRGMIEIEDLEEFNNFIKENKENLIKYSSKLEWRIGYNKNNNYSEKFFLKELENTFKKIEFLHREEITVKKGKFFSYTKFSLTDQVYEALIEWIRNDQNEKKSFAAFTRIF